MITVKDFILRLEIKAMLRDLWFNTTVIPPSYLVSLHSAPSSRGSSVYTKTPMYGSQTPMYGSQTPMHGSRTPMYGSQTPTHGDGKQNNCVL